MGENGMGWEGSTPEKIELEAKAQDGGDIYRGYYKVVARKPSGIIGLERANVERSTIRLHLGDGERAGLVSVEDVEHGKYWMAKSEPNNIVILNDMNEGGSIAFDFKIELLEMAKSR